MTLDSNVFGPGSQGWCCGSGDGTIVVFPNSGFQQSVIVLVVRVNVGDCFLQQSSHWNQVSHGLRQRHMFSFQRGETVTLLQFACPVNWAAGQCHGTASS